MDVSTDETLEIRDAGKLCGTYHYNNLSEPFFKSFFRGLYTPDGKNVVAPPPPDHPHHHGLQFGLCASDVNFWEEDKDHEPPYRQLPIGRQRTVKIDSKANGFSQQVSWELGTGTDTIVTFEEARNVSVEKTPGAYVWTWQTTLMAKRKVEIIKSVWDGPGYCGLGLRLIRELFAGGRVLPKGTGDGSTPTSVSFQGKGAEVTFEQGANQANALFVSSYEAPPGFAFMALGPTNLAPRTLESGQELAGKYVVRVADL